MKILRVFLVMLDIVAKVVLTMLAVSFIIRGVHAAYDWSVQIFDQRPFVVDDTHTVTVAIYDTDSVLEVGKKLEDAGLISDARLFWIQERLSIYHDMIAGGSYELSPSMTPDAMIEIMTAQTVADKKNAEAAEAAFAAANESASTDENQEEPSEADDGAGMAANGEEESADDTQPPAEGE